MSPIATRLARPFLIVAIASIPRTSATLRRCRVTFSGQEKIDGLPNGIDRLIQEPFLTLHFDEVSPKRQILLVGFRRRRQHPRRSRTAVISPICNAEIG